MSTSILYFIQTLCTIVQPKNQNVIIRKTSTTTCNYKITNSLLWHAQHVYIDVSPIEGPW